MVEIDLVQHSSFRKQKLLRRLISCRNRSSVISELMFNTNKHNCLLPGLQILTLTSFGPCMNKFLIGHFFIISPPLQWKPSRKSLIRHQFCTLAVTHSAAHCFCDTLNMLIYTEHLTFCSLFLLIFSLAVSMLLLRHLKFKSI